MVRLTSIAAAAVALAGVASGSSTPSTPLQIEAAFETFMKEHELTFSDPVEYLKRLAIFSENQAKIESHNAKGLSYMMKMNQFGHMTGDEFKAAMTGFSPTEQKLLKTGGLRKSGVKVSSTPFVWKGRKDELADSVDWTTQGAVTAVKNQGQCGSCWTFSTTGAIEGAHFLKSGNLVSLSEQEIVSCDTGGNGCGGGS